MILNGKVVSGLGEAEFWVNKIKKVFKEKANIELFAGTLNIQILNKYFLGVDTDKIFANEYGGTQDVLIKECKILGEKAYIVRTLQNEKEEGNQPINIIEIVSNINFRKKYNLQNGDKLSIEV